MENQFTADSKLSVSTWTKSVLAMSTMNPPEGGEKTDEGEKEAANHTSLLLMLSSRAKKHKLE